VCDITVPMNESDVFDWPEICAAPELTAVRQRYPFY